MTGTLWLAILLLHLVSHSDDSLEVCQMSASPAEDPKSRMTATIPRSLRKRIESTVPLRERSEFVAWALDLGLKRMANQKAIDFIKNIKPVPPRGGDSVEAQRRFRSVFD